jgi:GNAT superfamily N-acetyltransferase
MARTAGSVARSSSLAKSSKANRSSAPRVAPSRNAAIAAAAVTASRTDAQRTSAPPRLRLLTAKTGDHPLIHELLVSIFHGPSLPEFQAQLDEPGYAAADRLIVKDGEEIAAHLRLARQTIQAGSTTLPAARFMDLATAPQFRSRGLATALLAAGERAAADRGVLVGITRTRTPELFARQGWAICGRHTFSEASPRAVLAELSAQAADVENSQQTSPLVQRTKQPIIVRPLRRIELRAIVQLYEQNLAGRSGWPIRSEEYWEWLLARGACDRVYVASTCADAEDFATLLDSIIGYACVRQSRIVELVAIDRDVVACRREDVARQLVERVCADARELDGWAVRYDGPAGDGLHDLFRRAGGRVTVNQDSGGECFMAKLLDPLAALRRLTSGLAARAKAAKLPLPVELGIELRSGGGRKSSATSGVLERYRLLLDRRSARVETGGPSKHSIVLSYSDLTPLLLGDLSAESLLQASRLRPTTPRAKELALTLFEHETWFRPPLDDLLA